MSDDNVTPFPGSTTLDLSPGRVLQGAMDQGLETVVVQGVTKDGQEYFASSTSESGLILWLLARAARRLLQIQDETNPPRRAG